MLYRSELKPNHKKSIDTQLHQCLLWELPYYIISTTNFYDVSKINQPVSLTPGVYVLQIKTDESDIQSFKILKD